MANDHGFDALLYPSAWLRQEKQLSNVFFLSCALIIDTETLFTVRGGNNFHMTYDKKKSIIRAF